jgi:hypothetical protein
MSLLHRGDRWMRLLPAACGALLLAGCASPGPPRPPSLGLPQPVRDLSAERVGDGVELSYTAPWQSTDKLTLRGTTVRGVLCREVEHQGCTVVAGLTPKVRGQHTLVTWHDDLPAALASGPPRMLSYRVEFFNDTGRSAGPSEAALTVAGSAPAAVGNFHAEGSRLGVVLSWDAALAAEGEVILKREDLAPESANATQAGKQDKPRIVWLQSNATAGSTLDSTAQPGTPYRYTAVRERVAQLGGGKLHYRSAASAPIEFTLLTIYPPPVPSGLTAAGFADAGGSYAVDLVWQPVDDAGMVSGLAGYNVYREPLDASGHSAGERIRLNAQPVPLPAFHDTTARSMQRYRFSVTAVDNRGNESAAERFVLEPSTP